MFALYFCVGVVGNGGGKVGERYDRSLREMGERGRKRQGAICIVIGILMGIDAFEVSGIEGVLP